ncbi:MAG: M10 family metallopeptidase, partial [Pseudolabrys sp.]|nr:M10 family metallopeptidase [Pseudolabrys sp.]
MLKTASRAWQNWNREADAGPAFDDSAATSLFWGEQDLTFAAACSKGQPDNASLAGGQDNLATVDQLNEATAHSALNQASATFATNATLADFLVNGYWTYNGQQARHWASTTVTYNINGLTAGEKALAQSALNAWHEVANINFSVTTGAANITFNHNGSGQAFTSTNVSGANITSATIDISSDWWPNTNINSYMYQTYLHEIGHAIGLGHQGPYNGSATYGIDNLYVNDTWQWSVMSYFDQDSYGGATTEFVTTAEMADIYAIQSIYGAASTRTGSTTYGFNSNAGAVYDFSQNSGTAFTIYDSGGTDTIDCSGYSQNQIINLIGGRWSSIGSRINNIAIYLTSVIENVIGGTGNDQIFENGANNIINGGNGTDTVVFRGIRSAYNITVLAGVTTVIGPDGTDTLTNIENLSFTGQNRLGKDFNNDATSDVLWVNNAANQVGDWIMTNNTASFRVIGQSNGWTVAGTGDFNGDGTSDVLWINVAANQVGDWTVVKNTTTFNVLGKLNGWTVGGT